MSECSSDVCSSDLVSIGDLFFLTEAATLAVAASFGTLLLIDGAPWLPASIPVIQWFVLIVLLGGLRVLRRMVREAVPLYRSEEHTSELQSLMRISYAVFCLKKKITTLALAYPPDKLTHEHP